MPSVNSNSVILNKVNNMVLTINDFGPINHADIEINKINVIAGKNSTGKSTASKLLYCFIRADDSERQSNSLFTLRKEVTKLVEQLRRSSVDVELSGLIRIRNRLVHGDISDFDIEFVKKYFNLAFEQFKENSTELDDTYFILEQFKKVENLIRIIDENSQSLFEQLIINLLNSEFSIEPPQQKNRFGYKNPKINNKRHTLRLFRHLSREMDEDPILKDLLEGIDIQEIQDYIKYSIDKSIVEESKKKQVKESTQYAILSYGKGFANYKIDFDNFHFKYANWLNINNVLYIDSVSILDNYDSYYDSMEHTKYLKESLKPSSKKLFDPILNEKNIKVEEKINEIIKGNFSYSKSLKFNIGDESIEMKNTASGIKQIGIIQMLLANRRLNSNSFLIIDEPEVNLHPEWQVKFAEILVLLVNDLDISLYINSHSPLFIEAMDSWTEYYDLQDEVNYYLTEEVEDNKHTFKRIDNDRLYIIYDDLGKPYDEIASILFRKNLEE